MGELLGLALPRRVQERLLDLAFVRELWPRVVPEDLSGQAVPEALERGVLTIRVEDPAVVSRVRRRTKEMRTALLGAAGLPDARLRLRVLGSGARTAKRSPGSPGGA